MRILIARWRPGGFSRRWRKREEIIIDLQVPNLEKLMIGFLKEALEIMGIAKKDLEKSQDPPGVERIHPKFPATGRGPDNGKGQTP